MEENSILTENITEETLDESLDNNIYLPSGQALSAKETYTLTASEESRFIVLLGAVGSGKTAICTSIYSHFLEDKFENEYCFAGSKTLAAFEEYSFSTRTTSGRNTPAHDRTKKGTKNILHMRLYEQSNNCCANCLLADFSGEDYENAIGNTEYAVSEFQVLKSSNLLAVILDGEKLCSARTRLSEIQRSIDLLRTFYDSGLIAPSVPIIVVVSKFDLIAQANITNWHKLIQEGFSQQLPFLKSLIIIEVAPLSRHPDKTSVGYGIKTLFSNIMEQRCETKKDIKLPNTESEFEKWGRGVNN